MIQHRTHEATASFIKNLIFHVNVVFFCIIKYFEIHLASLRDMHTKRKKYASKYLSKSPI